MAKRKQFNPNVEWFKRMFQRKVVLVRAKLRDEVRERYMHLCTQCLNKRRKKARKETHWNRSSKLHNHSAGWRPPEYFSETGYEKSWSSTIPNGKCDDCGFTLKGR